MKKIAILTTSRADYGILERLIGRLFHDLSIEPFLIVSGSHLSNEFGNTVNSIKYPISANVEIMLSSDSEMATSKAIGLGCISFPACLSNINPDWLVLLGDRFEVLSAALSAYCLNIPIAHISGGERTVGSLDDGFRACITQLASLHFVYCEEYRLELLSRGIDSRAVHNVGCLTMEGLEKYWSKDKEDYYLVSWHPETKKSWILQKSDLIALFTELNVSGKHFIFCTSKGDAGSRRINELIDNFVDAHRRNRKPGDWLFEVEDFERNEFLTKLGRAKAIVGNSSAGIYEAPILGTPTINIGNRQKGRLQASSIINCEIKDLSKTIKELDSLSTQEYEIPFRGGDVSNRILDILKCTKS